MVAFACEDVVDYRGVSGAQRRKITIAKDEAAIMGTVIAKYFSRYRSVAVLDVAWIPVVSNLSEVFRLKQVAIFTFRRGLEPPQSYRRRQLVMVPFPP